MDRRGFLKKSAVVAGCTLVPGVAVAKVITDTEIDVRNKKVYASFDLKKSYIEEERWDIIQRGLNLSIEDLKEYGATIDSIQVHEKNGKIHFEFDCSTSEKCLKKANDIKAARIAELYKN